MAIIDETMSTLLVGFDSAWTPRNSGAIAAAFRHDDRSYVELGSPRAASFGDAERAIREWQIATGASRTVVLLDQPTVVRNARGQRPVEHIVSSPVCLRYGGVQPANTGKSEMFGVDAPVWSFLTSLDPVQDPRARDRPIRVLETYPVLAMIALGWMLPDRPPNARRTGRLPKYNPERRRTFSLPDWQHVCDRSAVALRAHGLQRLAQWIEIAGQNQNPGKQLQDCVDACICLLVALHLADGGNALLVGNSSSGYMVVPDSITLREELEARCRVTGRPSCEWIHAFRL